MIINTYFTHMGDTTVEVRDDSGLLCCINLPDDHKYYYQEFKRNLAHISQAVPSDVLDAIRIDNDTYLVLCNSHEAFHEAVSEVYQHVVIGQGIPEYKIILVSESADIYTEVQRVARDLGRQEIRALWLRIFEAACQRYLEHMPPEVFPNTLVDKIYDKKFINFNRRWRLHRPTLVALLKIRNILDKGYVSLAPCDDQNDWKRVWPWMLSHHSPELSSLLLAHQDEIFNIPDLYLDTTELMSNRADLETSSNYLYENSYFSVVSETNFYDFNPGRFVSEKIFKPIAFKHPFIAVSRPNTMSLMRELGYKTFHPWIDESYDTEADDNKRLVMIVDEIERLSNLAPSEVTQFLDGIRDICEYNKQLLSKKWAWITPLN